MAGPGPVESSGGGWTPETLLAHLTAVIQQVEDRITVRIESNDKRYEQRFVDAGSAVNTAFSAAKEATSAALSAAKEAVAKAENANDKRFEGVNEFRAALADQQRMLIPRVEAELRFGVMEKKIDILEKQNAVHGGERRGLISSWGLLVGGMLAVISVVVFVVTLLSSGAP